MTYIQGLTGVPGQDPAPEKLIFDFKIAAASHKDGDLVRGRRVEQSISVRHW